MYKIKYLLKFGKKVHIESFANGNLYFSNAKKYWEIEDETKQRGQGDLLEGSFKIYAQSAELTDYYNQNFSIEMGRCVTILRHETASFMPILCLFAVFENNCEYNLNSEHKILLSEKTINTIKTHFPDADSVAIIHDPKQFINDIKTSLNCDIQSGLVNYFNIDEGYILKNGQRALDLRLFKYITQDTPPEEKNEGKQYTLIAPFEYRVLFCKDVFFKEQQEYRIVLKDKKINESSIFNVQFNQEIQVKSIDEFFNEMIVGSN